MLLFFATGIFLCLLFFVGTYGHPVNTTRGGSGGGGRLGGYPPPSLGSFKLEINPFTPRLSYGEMIFLIRRQNPTVLPFK